MSTDPVVLDFKKTRCSKLACDVTGVPSQYGIYVVVKKDVNGKNSVLYIGQSDDLNTRLSNHEKYPSFINGIAEDEELIIYTAVVDSKKIDRVEQAMIYHFKPPLNSDHKSEFKKQDTTISFKGDLSTNEFTVTKMD